MRSSVILLLLLAIVFKSQCSYVAIAPKVFHPGWKYAVQLTVINDRVSGVRMTVTGNIFNARKQSLGAGIVSFDNGQSALLEIKVGANIQPDPNNVYSLQLDGFGVVTFSNSTSLQMAPLSRLVLIQADRTVYTTGQLIRFRVVIVNEDLKPLYFPKNITIQNPDQNTLVRYYCNGSKAVYENTYQLADFPDLGDWYIGVQSSEGNIDEKIKIRVVENVAPKLEVTATVTPDLLVKESNNQRYVTVSVTARDMNGKGVAGDIKVTVLESNMVVNAKMVDLSGLKDMEVDLNRELAVARSQLTLLVEVRDDTGRVSSTKVKVHVEEKPVRVLFDPRRTDHVYRTGMPFVAVLRVTDARDQPLQSKDLTSEVVMTLTDHSNHSNTVNSRVTLTPGQKEVIWNLTKINSTTDQLHLTTSFVVQGRKYEANETIRKYKALGKGTLNVRWIGLAPNLTMGGMAPFVVDKCNSTNFTSVTYMILSRGNIQSFGPVTLGQRVNALVTPHMCPKGRLVVYGLTEVSSDTEIPELIADSLYLTTEHCQGKRIKPKLKSYNLEAGSNIAVSLDVEWTDPRKQQTQAVDIHDVYVMAVDKRVVTLQGDYDITPARVEEALDRFVVNSTTQAAGGLSRKRRSLHMGNTHTHPPPTSTGDLLESLGLKVLGDVKLLDTHSSQTTTHQENTENHMHLDMSERTNFPDTWLWKTGRTDDRGTLTMVESLPDSVTSWMVSAFAVCRDNELTLTSDPLELNTYSKFYVRLNLPGWVRKGEKLEVRATVFNNHIINMDTTVTLAPSDNYIISGASTENLMVKRDQAGSVTFTVVADKVGSHTIMVTASARMSNGGTVSDTDEKKLTVQPEGVKRTKTYTIPVVPEGKKPYDRNVTLDFAPWDNRDVMIGSQRVEVRVTGNLLGSVVKHLERLVEMPMACGEQNLLSLVPSIQVLAHLTDTLHADLVARAKDNIRQGYIRQVQQYRLKDGGFSAFGSKDQEASTWLTALVVKTFAQAQAYVPDIVDVDIINSAVQFLFDRQNTRTGQFFERGRVMQEEMLNGAGAAESLSVFVTVCLQEAKKRGVQMDEKRLRQGVDFTRSVVSGRAARDNQFLAAVTAYALALNDPKTYTTQDNVNTLIEYVEAKGAPWKTKGVTKDSNPSSTHNPKPCTRDIQVTSYVLLTLNTVIKHDRARELVLWLISNQNDLGGFLATQDTMVAVQAIAECAVNFVKAAPYNDVVVTALAPSKKPIPVHIDATNAAIVQTTELPNETKKVNIYVTGDPKTLAIVKVVLTYYTDPNIQDKALSNNNDRNKLSVTTRTTMLRPGVHNIQACIREQADLQYNSMMVLCLALPSGFVPENLQETRTQNPMATRVHHKDDKVHFYMYQPRNDCLNLKIQETVKIDDLKPGSAALIAYYKPDIRSEAGIYVGCPDGRCTCTGSRCPASRAVTGTQPSHLFLFACMAAIFSLVCAL